MTVAPSVAVVLVSYEARDVISSALDSVRDHAGLPHEVVVVDNASGDGTAGAVAARHPGVTVFPNPANVGFARACNQGWRATRAPFVLFLNPDAEVMPGAIPALVALLERRTEVGAVGPRTRSADGTVQVSTGRDLTPLAEWRQRRLVLGVARRDGRVLAEAEAGHARERDVDWASGSCLLVRRTALEAVGGLDERFFLYEEDADLCRRLRAAGFRVVFTPDAEVRHRLGHSMARARALARLEYHRSHLLYYRLHNGPLARGVLRLLVAARGSLGWLRGALRRDAAARAEAGTLVRVALRGG